MRADLAAAVLVITAGALGRRASALTRGRQVRRRLGTPVTVGRLSPRQRLALVAVLGAVVGGMALGLLGCGPGGAAALLLERTVRRALSSRHAARIERDLPVALETIARVLRSGTSPLLAIAETGDGLPGPVGADLQELARAAARFGLRPAAVAWGRRRPQAALAARSLVVALDAGRGAADGLDAVAITLRERNTIAREVRALAAQARLSAAVMACTPVGFAALLSGTDPAARAFLVGSPAGLLCLGTGLLLDAVGYRWMRSIAGSPS